MLLALAGVEHTVVPGGEVGELDRQLGQVRGAAAAERPKPAAGMKPITRRKPARAAAKGEGPRLEMDGEGNGEFSPEDKGEADLAWIAYIVAEK